MKTVVIGAGAAGSALTWRLAREGHEVVCLERGDWVDNSQIGSDYAQWEKHRETDRSPLPSVRNSSWDYPIDDKQSIIGVANFNAVGGSTVLFSGHYPRFTARDFTIASDHGIGYDWPISYQELLPFYEINERMMHVGGETGDPFFPEITELRKPVRLGKSGELLKSAFKSLGWHIHTSYASINLESSEVLGVCRNLGPCNVGCPRSAKATADSVYMRPAIELGAKLITRASVSRVLMAGRSATGVEYFDSFGKRHVEGADRVVLASSAIGTPRVLLNSVSDLYPNGLGNHSLQVGKNLMIHPMAFVEGEFEHDLDTDIGPQGCMVFSLQFHRVPESDVELGYMLHALRGENPLQAVRRARKKRKLDFGAGLEQSFHQSFRKSMGIAVVAEDVPSESNFVELDYRVADSSGVPGVKVHYSLSENSKKLLAHGSSSAETVLRKAGAIGLSRHAPLRDTGWHTLGTARMGLDARNSVASEVGRIHETENVFICDSSLFPSASSLNPANTVQALALHVAENLVANE